MVFKDRWVEEKGACFTKDNHKHRNGAVITIQGRTISVFVSRELSDRFLAAESCVQNDLETIDEAKELAEEYISQLNEVGE